jgi:hypothetical protein
MMGGQIWLRANQEAEPVSLTASFRQQAKTSTPTGRADLKKVAYFRVRRG